MLRSTSAALFSVLSLSALAGCTPSARKEPPAETGAPAPSTTSAPASTPPRTSTAPRPSAPSTDAAPSSPSSAKSCASDADCRTYASYCGEAPCVCMVLAKGEPDPKCRAPHGVQCLVDPCRKKGASCQAGTCVLTPR